MKLTFHPKVARDLRWFRSYFGDSHAAAIEKYFKTLDLLLSAPNMGRPVQGRNAREYAIPRIPFSVIYRVGDDTIEILRIWDQRADRVSIWESV